MLIWPGIPAVSDIEISILLHSFGMTHSHPTSASRESCKSQRQQNKELSRQHVQLGIGTLQIFKESQPELRSLDSLRNYNTPPLLFSIKGSDPQSTLDTHPYVVPVLETDISNTTSNLIDVRLFY